MTATALEAVNYGFSREKIDLIKRTVAKEATDDELQLFLNQAQKKGLDPLSRQIYFQKRFNKKSNQSTMVIITAIDGYRLIAHRTGAYAGMEPTTFEPADGRPDRAAVTVYKIVQGIRCPFTASAYWSEYYPGPYAGQMWDKMPHVMLEKCAEALALRKAFPEELSGVYTAEEMAQADRDDAKPQPQVVDAPRLDASIEKFEEEIHGAESEPVVSSEYVFNFGAHSGKSFKEINPVALATYYDTMLNKYKNHSTKYDAFYRAYEQYAKPSDPKDGPEATSGDELIGGWNEIGKRGGL